MEKIKTISNIDIGYERIPSALVASDQESLIQLDVATKKAMDLITGKGKDQADIFKKRPEIIAFFKEEKTYKTK